MLLVLKKIILKVISTLIRHFLIGILFISIPRLVFAQSDSATKHSGKPKIYLVGAVHSMHFNPGFHYSVNDLLEQVIQLKPNVVCGEITPEAFEKDMEGYYPVEAAFLAEMATKHKYSFIPADWRIDASTQALAASIFPKDIENRQSDIDSSYLDGINKFNGASLYDFIHAPESVGLMDSLFEKVVGSNPVSEIAMGSWHERNRRIVENSLKYLNDSSVVVFVFGAAHVPQIKRQLEALGFHAEIPKRLFIPSDNLKISQQVINRWKKNLSQLTRIRDQTINNSYDNYQKVISSNRIAELTKTLELVKQ
ncbi:hypothetical protein [Filimonas effusa]|uniref:Uncharacterized protein n=1 Tax=Filimonas effusa TaxID=2508721 RepID=A0A4Q1DAG4_9BACT|nr:hypothetical protein [Filimonas effusa]RXK86377.1 hypothetical protein ESB13_06115 [Filimonas effusa]